MMPTESGSVQGSSAWVLSWLTPIRCRLILSIVLLIGFAGHLVYLLNDCPLDLSGDEAHYWDWSRQLGLSYYSKGPLVAYIIRASCSIFGDSAFAVRLPALVLAVATSLLTYALALRLFASERIALGAVLLNHLVPMFIAGATLMTIDPPMFFCWAAATNLAAAGIFTHKKWVWPAAGIALGIGFLAKYAVLLWLVGLSAFLIADQSSRRWLISPRLWAMVAIALVFTIPVLVWNQQHGWVSFHHVARQTGVEHATCSPMELLSFIGGQLGVIGPPLAVIMVGACVYAWRTVARGGPMSREMCFLLCMGLPFIVMVAGISLRAGTQPNWPAPAYYSTIILAAYFLATRMKDQRSWRRWRGWLWCAIVLGAVLIPIAHNFEIVYPLVTWINARIDDPNQQLKIRKLDPSARLRGWSELGQHLSGLQASVAPDSFIICADYMQAAETAFYTHGQPRTYYAGSYASDPARRRRLTQYDMWPDRQLDQPQLLGRSAIYVGEPGPDFKGAFDSIERLPDFIVVRRDIEIRRFQLWLCRGFHGMKRFTDGEEY